MTEPLPLGRVSAVDALVAALRARILDGDLPAGARLVERELVEGYGVARHTLRAALRQLAGDGHVELVPHRGAQVAAPRADQLAGLYELRAALETEAARLALARDPEGLRRGLAEAAAQLRQACETPGVAWSAIVDGHGAVPRAIGDAAHSPRIAAAHDALDAEMRLFLIALRPLWSLPQMAEHHEQLARDLPERGVDALREHLADGAAAVLADTPEAP
jgi:DNA-binding GntR family transcriptional regulator